MKSLSSRASNSGTSACEYNGDCFPGTTTQSGSMLLHKISENSANVFSIGAVATATPSLLRPRIEQHGEVAGIVVVAVHDLLRQQQRSVVPFTAALGSALQAVLQHCFLWFRSNVAARCGASTARCGAARRCKCAPRRWHNHLWAATPGRIAVLAGRHRRKDLEKATGNGATAR